MESPVKKLDLTATDKENKPFDADLAALEAEIDAKHSEKLSMETPKKEESKAAVAPAVKADQVEEPILQENAQRFVLFPIKYHEVGDASRSPWHHALSGSDALT